MRVHVVNVLRPEPDMKGHTLDRIAGLARQVEAGDEGLYCRRRAGNVFDRDEGKALLIQPSLIPVEDKVPRLLYRSALGVLDHCSWRDHAAHFPANRTAGE